MELGKTQRLKVARQDDIGVYLIDLDATDLSNRVLLPRKYVPEGTRTGDELEAFIYKDSKDRLIATTLQPKVTLGKAAVLTVKELSKIGAFLDWGLEKDLLLPYKEMPQKRPQAGDELLVRLYVDKSGRLAASTKGIYPLLSKNAPYRIGDEVEGRIYEFGHDYGTYVAVDDRYSAMIPRHEDTSLYHLGDIVAAYVTGVKEDGKLDLSLRQKAHLQMDADSAKLLEILESYAGVLPFTEKASPEVIFRETGLSKAAFKRAVGRLYKERKISLEDGKIRLV